MAKNNNKGFSLVEVIIAVAVFAILIIPLTRQLISSVKTNEKTTKKQYSVEMAEEIMESFKTAKLADDILITDGKDASGKDYKFEKTKTDNYKFTLPGSEGSVDYSIVTYKCDDVKLGDGFEKYSCEVKVSDIAYAVASKGYVYDASTNDVKVDDANNYVKTNAATGTIRTLDSNVSAIITGATYTGSGSSVSQNNLDNQAFEYFSGEKIGLLRNYDTYYNQYLAGAPYFSNDYFEKHTIIHIKKNAGKYLIQCEVVYTDHTNLAVISSDYAASGLNTYRPSTKFEDGIVFQQEYDEMPPIYLLYAPAIYDGNYVGTDYIDIDNSALAALSDCPTPKIYLFETASAIGKNYEKVICDQFGVSSVKQLVYNSDTSTLTQKGVKVNVNLASGSDGDKMKVYSNFDIYKPDSTVSVKPTTEDENDSVYYYDIEITITDSEGNITNISGTRGIN